MTRHRHDFGSVAFNLIVPIFRGVRLPTAKDPSQLAANAASDPGPSILGTVTVQEEEERGKQLSGFCFNSPAFFGLA